jgi:hypothetical protein
MRLTWLEAKAMALSEGLRQSCDLGSLYQRLFTAFLAIVVVSSLGRNALVTD